MKIGIIGGTGGMGKGFALRWCANHDVLIGSRDATKATQSALEYSKNAAELYGSVKGEITGNDNVSVAKKSDVLVLSIPFENIDSTCPAILSNTKDDCIVISPIVPMTKTSSGFEFISFIEKKPSAFEMVQKHMRDKTKLVAAFHTISEKKLVDPNLILDSDIFICGDDQNAIEIVCGLVKEIKNLRPLIIGPGSLSYLAEIATPILLNIMIKNKMKNPGIKIV
ncbi:MAG: NADPH-dependent F420 reductase [Nitrosopumilaceae archaeon]